MPPSTPSTAYDVVAQGKKKIKDDAEVRRIAGSLVKSLKSDLSIDWADQESVKAKIRAKVKRLLRRFGYSPREVLDIVPTIMEQVC